MPQAISLGIGEPDFVTPWKIREASIFALETEIYVWMRENLQQILQQIHPQLYVQILHQKVPVTSMQSLDVHAVGLEAVDERHGRRRLDVAR